MVQSGETGGSRRIRCLCRTARDQHEAKRWLGPTVTSHHDGSSDRHRAIPDGMYPCAVHGTRLLVAAHAERMEVVVCAGRSVVDPIQSGSNRGTECPLPRETVT